MTALTLALPVRAGLDWKESRLLLDPPPGASEAVGVFEFVNRGPHAVRITDVKSGCGCTVAALDQEIVPPGEIGRVRAVFHVEGRTGRQSVDVTVTAHEPEVRTYELKLEVAIKEFAALTPRLLHWRVGEERVAKRFRIALANNFRFVAAESTSADFSIVVVEQTNDAVQLEVTPRDLWAKRTAAIKIRVAQPGQTPVEVTAAVRVL